MAEIRTGKPDVAPDTPSHTKGVRQGNEKSAYANEVGHHEDGTADSRRSTGIRPKKRDPILPVMPNLPPG
ncbi:hypothetical protein D0T12_04225 [Actinomadura spongiicola]|uniref:Uncharacterized protein n=1 Tax=Actinomadura spongiicola TaxID=2303421 RepID=A0A372GPX9_9ACTN|nr:hypothetical protein [Actinomadura spongiicola]RFS87436.1 hypothetical protein D0T12_04225 [Actinomadura spongiicola]